MNSSLYGRGPQDGAGSKKTKGPSAGAYIIMGLLASVFGYLVTKDVQLPPAVLAAMALIGGTILFVQGISKPEIVTYVLVAYMPFSKVLEGDFGGLSFALNATNMLMGFIVFTWMNGKYAHGEPLWQNSQLNFPIMLFIGFALISLFRGSYFSTGYLWQAFIEFKRWSTPVFLFFLVLNTVKERWMIKNVVITMIIVTTLVGLMSIYDYIQIGDAGSIDNARVGGICEHSNSLAAFFAYYIFLPFGFFVMNRNKPMYWLLLIPFLIQFRGIMVTFSRGGYLAFALGLYILVFFRSKAMFLLLLLATAVAIANPVFLPAGIRYRMSQTFEKQPASYTTQNVDEMEGNLEASSKTRIEIWKGAIAMIKDNPVFGVGYGLFHVMIRHYWSGGIEIDAHNTYLILAAEMGIPALLVFLLLIAVTGIQTLLLYYETKDNFTQALALGFLGGIGGLMMSNMFGSRLDSQEVSSYFWILAALVMRLRMIEKRERERGPVVEGDQPPPVHVPWFERKGAF